QAPLRSRLHALRQPCALQVRSEFGPDLQGARHPLHASPLRVREAAWRLVRALHSRSSRLPLQLCPHFVSSSLRRARSQSHSTAKRLRAAERRRSPPLPSLPPLTSQP